MSNDIHKIDSKKVVIVGAGPVGLLLSIILRQKGLECKVYDPRAGSYTRPGPLLDAVFSRVLEELNKHSVELPSMRKPTIQELLASLAAGELTEEELSYLAVKQFHIKELERALYAKAIELGIQFEKKAFISINQEGLMVRNGSEEECISADLVFDVTGANASVTKSLIAQQGESPAFVKKHIGQMPVPLRLLAYVQLDGQLFDKIVFPKENLLSALDKLSPFGWNLKSIPNLTAHTFGKNKCMFYAECPEGLKESERLNWLQALLEVYNFPFKFTEVKPSQKYVSKPRITEFNVAFHRNEFSFESLNEESLFPQVVSVGDAACTPYFGIGNGVLKGLRQIEILLKHLDIQNEQVSFNAKSYHEEMKGFFEFHQGLITDAIALDEKRLIDDLESNFNLLSSYLELQPDNLSLEKHTESAYLQLINFKLSKIPDEVREGKWDRISNYPLYSSLLKTISLPSSKPFRLPKESSEVISNLAQLHLKIAENKLDNKASLGFFGNKDQQEEDIRNHYAQAIVLYSFEHHPIRLREVIDIYKKAMELKAPSSISFIVDHLHSTLMLPQFKANQELYVELIQLYLDCSMRDYFSGICRPNETSNEKKLRISNDIVSTIKNNEGNAYLETIDYKNTLTFLENMNPENNLNSAKRS